MAVQAWAGQAMSMGWTKEKPTGRQLVVGQGDWPIAEVGDGSPGEMADEQVLAHEAKVDQRPSTNLVVRGRVEEMDVPDVGSSDMAVRLCIGWWRRKLEGSCKVSSRRIARDVRQTHYC